jgi:hypothetical protein
MSTRKDETRAMYVKLHKEFWDFLRIGGNQSKAVELAAQCRNLKDEYVQS